MIQTFRELTGLTKGSRGSGGAGGAGSGGAGVDGNAADMQGAWKAELERKLGRKALIEQNYQERQADLARWAGEVNSCRVDTLQELQGFVEKMEGNLRSLVDEQAVLRLMGDEWPHKRYDDMLAAVKECR